MPSFSKFDDIELAFIIAGISGVVVLVGALSFAAFFMQ